MSDTPEATSVPASQDRDLDVRWLLRMGGIVLLIGVFVAFALQNSETVEVEFLWWSFETSRIILLIGSAVVGIVVWELASFVRRRRRKAD
jgi:uncharacterized integral membrane protein